VKTFLALCSTAVMCLLTAGFATDVNDIDVKSTLMEEQQSQTQQLEQQMPEIAANNLAKQLQRLELGNRRPANAATVDKDDFVPSVVCQVGQKCSELFPGKGALCHANSDEEVCRRQGRWLNAH